MTHVGGCVEKDRCGVIFAVSWRHRVGEARPRALTLCGKDER